MSGYRPLADRMRPLTLDDMVGQQHLIGEGTLLRRMIETGRIANMIFYGPSGVGKTTLANIIARSTGLQLFKLNATTAGISDIRAILSEVGQLGTEQGILLYLDEIQYFNKKQQQSLLEVIESGEITLIASTTENPYFYVYNAILSRSTVFEFQPITSADILAAVTRAVTRFSEDNSFLLDIEEGALEHVAFASGGDVRKALNAAEFLLGGARLRKNTLCITLSDAQLVAQKSHQNFDRDGDVHYDLLSALHKSVRGSDADAAIYYLARLLSGGDILSPCRRLLCIASEDVGPAYPQAISIVKACVDSARELGLPEAMLALANAVVLLCTVPKSNSASSAIGAAMADVQAGAIYDPPAAMRDAHYEGAKALNRGQSYQYPHNFPGNYVKQDYLPQELSGKVYYTYGDNKIEQAAKQYWDLVKGTPDCKK